MVELNRRPIETQVLDILLEGNPLVITEVTRRRDGSFSREVLLSNGREDQLIVKSIDTHPGIYSVGIYGRGRSKGGGRYFTMGTKTRLEFTGLTSGGGSATLSINPETDELNFEAH
jgi:hypothetical protein